jgi:hypothetical protein
MSNCDARQHGISSNWAFDTQDFRIESVVLVDHRRQQQNRRKDIVRHRALLPSGLVVLGSVVQREVR